ncbi:MAG TPA: peptidylprolyl isomerase [Polyangiales bacterium]|nr:peptidylprolyl isomerase [Polyangiales bacterium]
MTKLSWVSTLALIAAFGCNKIEEPAATDKTDEPPPKAAEPAAAASEPKAAERTSDGYEVVRSKTGSGEAAEVEVKAPEGWKIAQPPSTPDPRGGKFALKDALKDLPGKQPLVATIRTNLGTLYCDLFDDKAPVTVANFVGLARGTRETWSAKDSAWVKKPYYDGTTFHRVIPGFMIQGGDYAGDGSGNLWYTIPDEVHPSLKHDRAGQLCMANRGPNTNEGQFFITEGAAPHLDGSYSIFGQCIPTEIVNRIARVPQSGPPNNRPLTPVVMEKVTIERRAGGANAAAAGASVAPSGSAPAAVPAGKAVRVDEPK